NAICSSVNRFPFMVQVLLSKMQSYKKPRIPSGPRIGEQVSHHTCADRRLSGTMLEEAIINSAVNLGGEA
ncbi:MAG TPA: hypothetical protein VMJ32_17915, partial [Pirellulales bacterium]|nr:hypothetical protein [Pirellulales bacterium]